MEEELCLKVDESHDTQRNPGTANSDTIVEIVFEEEQYVNEKAASAIGPIVNGTFHKHEPLINSSSDQKEPLINGSVAAAADEITVANSKNEESDTPRENGRLAHRVSYCYVSNL